MSYILSHLRSSTGVLPRGVVVIIITLAGCRSSVTCPGPNGPQCMLRSSVSGFTMRAPRLRWPMVLWLHDEGSAPAMAYGALASRWLEPPILDPQFLRIEGDPTLNPRSHPRPSILLDRGRSYTTLDPVGSRAIEGPEDRGRPHRSSILKNRGSRALRIEGDRPSGVLASR